MKKLLFVGKFNTIFEDINRYLANYFHVQVCIDKPDLVRGILNLNMPDLVLISMFGMNLEHVRIFADLRKLYPGLPVVCIGTENEQSYFLDFLAGHQFHVLTRPIGNDQIGEKIAEALFLTYDETRDKFIDNVTEKKCIMIVDDNPTQLRMMNEILQDVYDVQMATSGMKALTLIGKRVPNLIFLDYEMPLCDGKMTMQMIREVEEAKDIPIVFLTGVRDMEHIRAVVDLKPAGYLLKPATAAVIFDAIEKFIQ